ncbi:MAG: ATP-binding protein [Candidatus Eisenbacteria bacterium]|nr:ATP-binding protein [Candidatus Eisenbacteria bacterium]
MGETRVDLLHLLEDLRDAYTGSLEETILSEIVANSLDSGATRISFATDTSQATLVVVDNGCGMLRRELSRYHDIAASTKARGDGIGFAGVGIKLSLLLCREVLTETRRGKSHVATLWHLASRHRAPWKWIPPPGVVETRGTAVQLRLHNALSPLVDRGYIEGALHRHYRSLLDPAFELLLGPHYPHGMRFEVDGREVQPAPATGTERAWMEMRLARKRKPSAAGYLVREPLPLPEDQRGLTICTLGKAIKGGWDWLGLGPAALDRIGGCIEAPALAACLTLNKADFIRSGPRGAVYLAYRKAIQEAVARQLAAWGDEREVADAARRRMVKPLERDLERVLLDLAGDFPLLASLVEHRKGGQRSLPMGSGGMEPGHAVPGEMEEMRGVVPGAGAGAPDDASPASPQQAGGEAGAMEEAEESASGTIENPPVGESPLFAGGIAGDGPAGSGRGPSARAPKYGLGIQFEPRPGDPELGRLVESTVWINEAHPAYSRATASRSEGYHVALAVALALAPLAVEPAGEHAFVTRFLSKWGEALGKGKAGRSRSGRTSP